MSTPVTAMDRSPGEAIMAGFSLVAADNPSLGPTLRAAAKRASEEFIASIDAVPDHGRERQYLNELRMAAVSFAAGLTRRQHERGQRIAAAEEERELNIRRIVQTQRIGGVLRGGLQLLALGGFTYAFISAVFSVRIMKGETVGLHREYAALATALASTLIGSFFKAWYTNLRINQVDKRYKQALREAKDVYHAEAVQEYEYAAQEANLAWTKFTGRPPAITDAFRVLIVGLLAGDRELEVVQAKSAAKIEEEMEGDQDPLDESLIASLTPAGTDPPPAPRTPGSV